MSKESEKLQQAWEEFFNAFTESLGISKFVRWLADKLSDKEVEK